MIRIILLISLLIVVAFIFFVYRKINIILKTIRKSFKETTNIRSQNNNEVIYRKDDIVVLKGEAKRKQNGNDT